MAYRIYTETNYADTSRDPDDIHITELGYKHQLDDALKFANEYIKEHFFHKDTELHYYEDGYEATDFRSYGATIYVKEIKIN
jgi:sulfur relay (sulfurtransferase) complex TusBCD TusD component (DsrE family)